MCKKYNIKKYKYIFYIYTLLVCLSVCLYQINVKTAGLNFVWDFFVTVLFCTKRRCSQIEPQYRKRMGAKLLKCLVVDFKKVNTIK